MRKRPLGRTPVTLGELTLGTWALSGEAKGRPLDRDRFDAMVGSALAYGIDGFDVSPLWADGEAETALGAALRGREAETRKLITRGGARREGDTVVRSFDAEALRADCEGSLERLGVDALDLWLLYGLPEPGDDGDDGTEGIEEAVALLTRDGKVRAWGVCAETVEDVERAIALSADAVSLPYDVLRPNLLDRVASDLAARDLGVLVRSPLAHGLLGGTWDAQTFFPEGDHRRDRWPTPAAKEARLTQVDTLRFLASADPGIESMAEAALRFVLHRPEVTTALISPGTPNQLRELARASVPEGEAYLPEDAVTRVGQVLAAMGL